MPKGVWSVQADAGGARAGGIRAGTIPPGRGREAGPRIGSAAGGGGMVTASPGGNGAVICKAAQIGHQGALPNGGAGRRPDQPSAGGSTEAGLRQRDASTHAGGAPGWVGVRCTNGSSAWTTSAATASRAAQARRRAVFTPSVPAPPGSR